MADITVEVRALLVRAVELTKREREAREMADTVLATRDDALAKACDAGVTMYRLSQETGLSKSAIRAAVIRGRNA
jgi:hypothetical protein